MRMNWVEGEEEGHQVGGRRAYRGELRGRRVGGAGTTRLRVTAWNWIPVQPTSEIEKGT